MSNYNTQEPTNADIERVMRVFRDSYGGSLSEQMYDNIRKGLMFIDRMAYSNGYEQGKRERAHQCEVVHIHRQV